MKNLLLLFLFSISLDGFCQNEDRLNVNYGSCNTDSHTKLFANWVCIEGCYPTEQNAKRSFDFKILYEKSIGADFFIPVGIGLYTKGFSEKGMVSEGNNNYLPYSKTFSLSYISFYLGLSFDLIAGKKFTLNVGQLLNPELRRGGLYKTMPVSTRTTVSLQYRASKRIAVHITPFYQTCLSPYNEAVLYPESSNWTPYGYGINVGILWFKPFSKNSIDEKTNNLKP